MKKGVTLAEVFTPHFIRQHKIAARIIRGGGRVTSDRHLTSSADAPLYRKFGFTLAEVLITLGIIGVVASMTLPALVNKYQKQVTVTKLKKAYTILSQVMVSSQADNGPARDWVDDTQIATEDNMKEYFDKYWAPYLKISKFCDTQTSCGYRGATHYYNGTQATLSFWGKARSSILTNDGMYMLFRNIGDYADKKNEIYYLSKTQLIFVDVNAGKKPNVYGKDIFVFVVELDKPRISPYGYDKTDNDIDKKCYSETAGYMSTCAARIMRDGWEIKYF